MRSPSRPRNPFCPRNPHGQIHRRSDPTGPLIHIAVSDPGLRDMAAVLVTAARRSARIVDVAEHAGEAAVARRIILDGPSAATLLASRCLPRGGLADAVLVADGAAGQRDYEVGLAARVQAVLALPHQQDDLAQWLYRATQPMAGPVVTITGGSGGCGATALAVVCAQVAARSQDVAVVDAAWRHAGVAERVGAEGIPGMWLDEAVAQLRSCPAGGEVNDRGKMPMTFGMDSGAALFDPHALNAQLPRRGRLAIAGWADALDGTPSPVEQADQDCRTVITHAVDALRHSGAVVVVDEPDNHPRYAATHRVLVATNTEWSLRQAARRLHHGGAFTHTVVRCTRDGTVSPHAALSRLGLPGAVWRHDRRLVTPSALTGPHTWGRPTGRIAAQLTDHLLATALDGTTTYDVVTHDADAAHGDAAPQPAQAVAGHVVSAPDGPSPGHHTLKNRPSNSSSPGTAPPPNTTPPIPVVWGGAVTAAAGAS